MTSEEVNLTYAMAGRLVRRLRPLWMDVEDVRQEYAIEGWKAFEKIGYFHKGYIRRSMCNRFLDLLVKPHLELVSIHADTDDEEMPQLIVEPACYDLYLPVPKDAEMRSLIVALATYQKDEARQVLGYCKHTWQHKMRSVRSYVEENTR